MIVFAVIIAVLILIMNLSVHVETKITDKKFSIVMKLGKIKIFKAPILKKKKPEKENKSTAKEKTKDDTAKQKITVDDISFYFSSFRDLLKDLKKLMRYSRKKIVCEKLFFELTFGKEEAAQVGMMYGFIWAGIGSVLPLLQSMMILKEHRIAVVPVYNQDCFSVSYEGNFRMKIHHIVVIGLKSFSVFIKYLLHFSKHKKNKRVNKTIKNKKGGVSNG